MLWEGREAGKRVCKQSELMAGLVWGAAHRPSSWQRPGTGRCNLPPSAGQGTPFCLADKGHELPRNPFPQGLTGRTSSWDGSWKALLSLEGAVSAPLPCSSEPYGLTHILPAQTPLWPWVPPHQPHSSFLKSSEPSSVLAPRLPRHTHTHIHTMLITPAGPQHPALVAAPSWPGHHPRSLLRPSFPGFTPKVGHRGLKGSLQKIIGGLPEVWNQGRKHIRGPPSTETTREEEYHAVGGPPGALRGLHAYGGGAVEATSPPTDLGRGEAVSGGRLYRQTGSWGERAERMLQALL